MVFFLEVPFYFSGRIGTLQVSVFSLFCVLSDRENIKKEVGFWKLDKNTDDKLKTHSVFVFRTPREND